MKWGWQIQVAADSETDLAPIRWLSAKSGPDLFQSQLPPKERLTPTWLASFFVRTKSAITVMEYP